MPERLSQQELESYLWGAATILRGLVDAGDYKQYVFPLLFYKRLSDVWDEEFAGALAETGDEAYALATANDRFVIPAGAHWNDVRTAPRDVGQAIRDAMRAIEAANPDRLDGIFGDAPWTNKERLPDRTLKNLLEHFSAHTLSVANVPEDELGMAYEFLIKKFADDSGHTAQEFYTNRTVVHLMVQMLDPQPGESIYDPTCGTGGMLISALDQVKRSGGEHRTLAPLRPGAQPHDRRHRTHEPGAARRRGLRHRPRRHAGAAGLHRPRPPAHLRRGAGQPALFHQAVEPRRLAERSVGPQLPRHTAAGPGRLRLLPAHPGQHGSDRPAAAPSSSRTACSSARKRQEMRRKLVEADLVECVLGLGPNLFYNSPMEACVVVCRSRKPAERQGRILFIDAVDAVARERAMSFLRPEHQTRIVDAYHAFAEEPGFARAVPLADVAAQDYSLSIPLYVKRLPNGVNAAEQRSLPELWAAWEQEGRVFWQEMDALVEMLDELIAASS